jgi:para-nitrobenzyl esterase
MESGTIFALDVFPFARGNLSLSFNLSSLLLSIFGATDDAEGLARFREADPALLTRLTPFSFDFAKFGAFGLSPVMDGNVIPLDPQKSLAQGEGQKVKVLMGFNGNEGSLFVPAANGKEDPQVYKDAVALALGAEASKAFWERYPIDDNHGAVERARQAFGYSFMTSNMKRFADLQARQSDLYFYQFHYVSKDGKDFGLGAYHSAELAFVFGVKEPNHNDTEAEQVLSDEMRLRWVNFIKNGDPNLGLAPPTALEWPKYDPKDPRVIIFDQQVSVAPLPDQEGLDFMAEAIWGPLP